MNILHNHFLQIYVLFLYTYGKRIGENGLSKIFFENWRTTKLCENKEQTSKQCETEWGPRFVTLFLGRGGI
jgi:uncharacterized ion transporter superfamily protein YfcC